MTTPVLWIIPTRGRPDQCAQLHQQLGATCVVSDWVFAIDDDDPDLQGYLSNGVPHQVYRLGPRRGLAGSTNECAAAYGAHYQALGSIGDDHWPYDPWWDADLWRAMVMTSVESTGVWDGIGWAYPNDLHWGYELPTACLIGRRALDVCGWLCPPQLDHLMIDVVWRDLGDATGRRVYRDSTHVEHRHPAFGKAPDDDGYRAANSDAQVERDGAAYAAFVESGGLARAGVLLSGVIGTPWHPF